MKRLLLGGLIALAVVPTAGAAGSSPRTRVENFLCQHALDPPTRAISIRAVMKPLPGTMKLAARFQLIMKAPPSNPARFIHQGDLGKWISPKNPTLGQLPGDVWKISHPVVDLPAPASYRFRVSFRWTGAGNHVIGTAVRFSRRCFQPELRPDLQIQQPIGVSPGPGPNLDQYSVTIRNGGSSAAGPFEVEFKYGNVDTLSSVQGLGAGQTLTERFAGPACTGTTGPTVIVDPAGQVDDYDRSNNTLTVTCPSSSAPPGR